MSERYVELSRFKAVIAELAIDPVDAARQAGVDSSTWCRWLDGATPVPWSTHRMFSLVLQARRQPRWWFSWSDPDAAT